MSLYAQYLIEKTDDKIIENDDGFITYRYLDNNKTVYIVDIYVQPNIRKQGLAARMADVVVDEAKRMGCIKLIGSVVPSNKNSADSMKVLLAYGMKPSSSSNDFIIFEKEIKQWEA